MITLVALSATAQEKGTGADNRIYPVKELSEKPVLASGTDFESYFQKNFHPAKPIAEADISFTIEKGGVAHTITLFKVDDAAATQEAQRVLRAAGKWKPGTKDGKTVRVLYKFKYKSAKK